MAKAFGFLTIGAICAGLTVLLTISKAVFLRRARRATGEVTAIEVDSAEFPVVTFNADGDAVAGGRVVTFRSNVSSNGLGPGSKVPVVYDPRSPEGASIESLGQFWLPVVITFIFAAGFTAVGALVYLAERAPAQRPSSTLE